MSSGIAARRRERNAWISAHLGDAIPFEDKKAIEDVTCYLVRSPLSLKKLVYLDGQKAVLYRSRMNPSLGAAADVSQATAAETREIKIELRRRLHVPVPEVGKWLGTVLRGHFNYYGVPQNSAALSTFRYFVSRLWWRTLRRRSQKTRMTWERMRRLVARYLPLARITHPYPSVRFRLST